MSTYPVSSRLLTTHFDSWVVLDPNEKTSHFKKYWDDNLQKEATEDAECIVSILKTKEKDCINIRPPA